MSGKTIAGYLGNDITSRTAANVVTANPGVFPGGPSTVPLYMYQSLREMLGFPDQATLQDHIVARYGSNLTMPTLGIEIALETQDAALSDVETNARYDVLGGEFGYARILSKIHDPVLDSQYDLVEQIDLRIRYLIETEIRQYTQGSTVVNPRGSSIYLNPATFDTTIDANLGVCVRWIKYGNSESALERVSIYSVQYARLFCK